MRCKVSGCFSREERSLTSYIYIFHEKRGGFCPFAGCWRLPSAQLQTEAYQCTNTDVARGALLAHKLTASSTNAQYHMIIYSPMIIKLIKIKSQFALLACLVGLFSKEWGMRAVDCLSRWTVVVHDKCQRTQQVNLPVCVQNQSSYWSIKWHVRC